MQFAQISLPQVKIMQWTSIQESLKKERSGFATCPHAVVQIGLIFFCRGHWVFQSRQCLQKPKVAIRDLKPSCDAACESGLMSTMVYQQRKIAAWNWKAI